VWLHAAAMLTWWFGALPRQACQGYFAVCGASLSTGQGVVATQPILCTQQHNGVVGFPVGWTADSTQQTRHPRVTCTNLVDCNCCNAHCALHNLLLGSFQACMHCSNTLQAPYEQTAHSNCCLSNRCHGLVVFQLWHALASCCCRNK
jgi:hypothetical protein